MPILPSHRKYLHGHFHSFLNPSIKHHQRLSTLLSPNSTANVAGRTLGYRKMPPTSGGYILAKRSSHMISFVDSMLNILARMIFQLIPPPRLDPPLRQPSIVSPTSINTHFRETEWHHLPHQTLLQQTQWYHQDRLSTTTCVRGQTAKTIPLSATKAIPGRDPHGRRPDFA